MKILSDDYVIPTFGEKEIIMISEEDMKEQLSYAYVHTVSSRAGFFCGWRPYPDRESVDVIFSANGKIADDSLFSPKMEAQLKGTSTHEVSRRDNNIHFRVSHKNYDDLRLPSAVPRLLIVLLLPENRGEWLTHTNESLISRRCAYWYSLNGLPEVSGEGDVTVQIPSVNIFSPDALTTLMIKASKDEEIINGSE